MIMNDNDNDNDNDDGYYRALVWQVLGLINLSRRKMGNNLSITAYTLMFSHTHVLTHPRTHVLNTRPHHHFSMYMYTYLYSQLLFL